MPAVCRKGDRCSGHGCWPPRQNIQGNNKVYTNGRETHLRGHNWAIHCCRTACHMGSLAKGSSKVFVQGIAVGRVGDPVSCGSAIAEGARNVYAGG